MVTDNIRKNKNQHNYSIENEPDFDHKFSLSRRTKDLLPVVTVRIREGKKQREKMIEVLTCLLDSGATDIMIEIKHDKHYEHRMRSNKVEYITASGTYYTMHNFKGPFCMP